MIKKNRYSNSREIHEIESYAPMRAPVLDFICFRNKFQDKVERDIKGRWYVTGQGTRFRVMPPVFFNDRVLFKEKFRLRWWSFDFTEAIIQFADQRFLKRKLPPEVLRPLVNYQIEVSKIMVKGRRLKHYFPHHFAGNFWLPGSKQPDQTSRLECRVTWLKGCDLHEAVKEITNKVDITEEQIRHLWNTEHKNIGCDYDTPSLVWLTHFEVKKYSRGTMDAGILDKETRLNNP